MNSASEKILISRMIADKMMHLSRCASYRMLRRSGVRGKVRMADVRAALAAASRNGAKWEGGDLVEVNGKMFDISQRSLFRHLKRAPHFRISRKVALVEKDKLEDFIK